MKKSSRYMPKYIQPKESFTFVAWLFLIFMVSFLLSVAFKYPLLILVLPILATWTYIDNKKRNKKYNSLLKERQDLSICEFSQSFNCKEIDTWVIRAAYEQIQEYVSSENTLLPIKAEDNIFEVLDIDEEDFELDIVEEIIQRTGRSMKNSDKNPYYGEVSTVRDLVLFINEQPIEENT